MVYELERVLRVCNGFLCSMSVTYDGAVLLWQYCTSLPGFVCLVGDMNIHFDNPLQSLTKQTLSTLSLNSLVQVINKLTHRCGHIIDWVIVRPDDDIHRNLLLQTHLNQTTIALNPASIFH